MRVRRLKVLKMLEGDEVLSGVAEWSVAHVVKKGRKSGSDAVPRTGVGERLIRSARILFSILGVSLQRGQDLLRSLKNA
jgi:hypothetical protein